MQPLADNPIILILIGMGGTALAAAIFILFQVRSQRRLWRQQERLKEMALIHQKELLHTMIRSQETERQRIGMDLHDEVGTVLSSLRMTIDRSFTGSTAADCREIIDKVIIDVRRISHDLSPFAGKAYRFIDALEDLCTPLRAAGQLHIGLNYEKEEWFDRLPVSTALALYRVLAELINNTLRHARASVITVSFRVETDIMDIDYSDNGRGLSAGSRSGGMGLSNIESRLTVIGATFEMTPPAAGGGFRMEIHVRL